MNWATEEPVPSEIVEHLPRALAASEHSLAAASPKSMGLAIGKLLNWIEQFGIVALPAHPVEREEWKIRTTEMYNAALSSLPSDLLNIAIDRTMETHTFRNLPLAGDIRAKVDVELFGRRELATKIKSAVFFTDLRGQKATRDAPRAAHKPRTEAEKQAAAEAVAKAREILDSATLKRVPTAAGDHRTPAADPYRTAYAVLKRTGDE
jgi:hypothetical protein